MREIIKYTSVTDQLVRQSLQECIDQFIGTKLTPVTLSMLDQVIKQYVEGVRDPVQHCGQHVKLDITTDPDDPTKVNITPLDLYTAVILTGQFDRSYDEIQFLTRITEDNKHHTTYEYENSAGKYRLTRYHYRVMDHITGEIYTLHEPEFWFFPVEKNDEHPPTLPWRKRFPEPPPERKLSLYSSRAVCECGSIINGGGYGFCPSCGAVLKPECGRWEYDVVRGLEERVWHDTHPWSGPNAVWIPKEEK